MGIWEALSGKQLDRIEDRLAALQWAVQLILIKENRVMATLDDVLAETARDTEVTASAVTLLNRLTQMVQDALNTGDPAKVQAVLDQVRGNTDALAAAVIANTPAQ